MRKYFYKNVANHFVLLSLPLIHTWNRQYHWGYFKTLLLALVKWPFIFIWDPTNYHVWGLEKIIIWFSKDTDELCESVYILPAPSECGLAWKSHLHAVNKGVKGTPTWNWINKVEGNVNLIPLVEAQIFGT